MLINSVSLLGHWWSWFGRISREGHFPINRRWTDSLPAADRMWVPSLYAGLAVFILGILSLRLWGPSKKAGLALLDFLRIHVWLVWLVRPCLADERMSPRSLLSKFSRASGGRCLLVDGNDLAKIFFVPLSS